MTTLGQCITGYVRKKKKPSSRTFKLRKRPQLSGVVRRMFIMSPKKPNSGKRRVAKIVIKHAKRRDRITARIVGYDYLLRKFAHVLVRGGRANDTPGVTYSCIRGSLDFVPFYGKKSRRSFWGLKREELFGWVMLFIRRNLRQQYEGMESFQKEQQALRERTQLPLQPQGFTAYHPGSYSNFWYDNLDLSKQLCGHVAAGNTILTTVSARRSSNRVISSTASGAGLRSILRGERRALWLLNRQTSRSWSYAVTWLNLLRL